MCFIRCVIVQAVVLLAIAFIMVVVIRHGMMMQVIMPMNLTRMGVAQSQGELQDEGDQRHSCHRPDFGPKPSHADKACFLRDAETIRLRPICYNIT